MKILLTSGGTRVPVDKVRFISNRSHGTFGSRIAWELLRLGLNDTLVRPIPDVYFLTADRAETPFSVKGNCAEETLDVIEQRLQRVFGFHHQVRHYYHEIVYKDFADYADKLESLTKEHQFDAVVLAAAVSDYLCDNYVDGKVRSDDDLVITLDHAPKLIGQVKKWWPATKLVGFKLLVDSTNQQLIDAARHSIETNNCEFVVANDLRDILEGKHRLLICDRQSVTEYKERSSDPYFLAWVVAERVLEMLS